MKKRQILKICLLSFILLVIAAVWYLNTFIAPVKFKAFFIKSISQAIDRPVSLGSARFSLLHGFVLKDLAIFEPDEKTVFIRVKNISTGILLVPLINIKDRIIIIPAIRLRFPAISIIKKQDNTWNFLNPPLLKSSEIPKKTGEPNFSIVVRQIKFKDAQLSFADETLTPKYARQLINVDGEAMLSINGAIQFKATGRLDTPLKTALSLQGSYTINDHSLDLKANVQNLSLLEPYTYFYKAVLFAELKNGITNTSIGFKMNKNNNIIIDMNSSIKNLDLSSSGLTLKGDVGASGTFIFNPPNSSPVSYNLELNLNNPTLSGISLLNEISNLQGKIKISNTSILCDYLWGNAYGTSIRFNFDIKDLNRMYLTGGMQADLDLANYKSFIPKEFREKVKDIDLKGPAAVDIKFAHALKGGQPLLVEGNIKLKDAILKTAILPDKIKIKSGNIAFKNEEFFLTGFAFDYGGKNYTLNSKVADLKLPDIKMKLQTNDLSLMSRFKIWDKGVHILRARGKYLNSSFDLAGDITDFNELNANVKGGVSLDLLDLRKVVPALMDNLSKFDVKGSCNLDAYINGPLRKPKVLDISLKGTSDRVEVWGSKIDAVAMNLQLKNQKLLVEDFSAKPYGGTFASSTEVDFSQQNPPYSIKFALEGVDLNKFIFDTPLKGKPVSGKAMAKLNMRGFGKNTETIKGEGIILIKGGYLWEVPLLKGLADLLFLPNLSSIVFDEVSANFIIANKNISTSDLTLHSPNVNFLANGSMGFNGSLDFLVTTSVSEDLMKGISTLGQIAGALLSQAGQLIGDIKVGGTIKKPEYKFKPLPIDKVLKDKLKGIFGGIF